MGLLFAPQWVEGDIHESEVTRVCMRTSHTHYTRVVCPRGIPGAFLNLVSYFFVLLISAFSHIT